MRTSKRGNGDGSIYQRESDGRWVGAVSLGVVGSKPIRRTVYGDTQREVVAKMTKLKEEHRQHLPVAADRQTMADYLDHWIENVARLRLRFNTFGAYREIVKLHLKPALGRTKLIDLTVDHCDALWRQKLKENLSPRRVQYVRAVLRTALQSAVKKGKIARNVAALSDCPRIERQEVEPLTVAETRKLIEKVRGNKYETVFLLAIFLGLRRGEILGLTWSNVKLDEGIIHINRQLQTLKKEDMEGLIGAKDMIFVGKNNALVPLKTKKSHRTLELTPLLAAKLKGIKARQSSFRIAAEEWPEHDLVFTHEDGRAICGRMITLAWHNALSAAKLPKKRFHDARHGAGSTLLELGVDLKTVSSWLGHSTVQLTADVYLHSRRVTLGEAGAKLDKVYS